MFLKRRCTFYLRVCIASMVTLYACKQSDNLNQGETWYLEEQKEVRFPLDSTTSYETTDVGYLEDKGWFYFLDRDHDKLYYYDIRQPETPAKKVISFRENYLVAGVEGIAHLPGDTLALFGPGDFIAYAVGDSLVERHRILFYTDGRYTLFQPYYSGMIRPLYRGKGKVLIGIRPLQNRFAEIDPEITVLDLPLLGSVDLFSGEVEYHSVFYPSSVMGLETRISSSRFFFTAKEDTLLMGFSFDPLLYQIPMDSVKLGENYQVVSTYPVDLDGVRKAKPGEEREMIERTSFIYYYMLYDPWRKVYYRFVKHPNWDYKEDTFYNSTAEEPRGASVMIFDEHFKKLGETTLKGFYFFQASFVGPDGLYISKNNSHHPELEEDWFKFDVFVPQRQSLK